MRDDASSGWNTRVDDNLAAPQPGPVLEAIVLAVLMRLGFGALADRFGGRHVVGAMDDGINGVEVRGAVGLVVFVTGLMGVIAIPQSVPITATLVAVMLAVGLRLVLRLTREHRVRPDVESVARVLIFSAGVDGQQLVRSCGPCSPTRPWPSSTATSVALRWRR